MLSVQIVLLFFHFCIKVFSDLRKLLATLVKLQYICFSLTYALLGFGLVQKSKKNVSEVLEGKCSRLMELLLLPVNQSLNTFEGGLLHLGFSLSEIILKIQKCFRIKIIFSFQNLRINNTLIVGIKGIYLFLQVIFPGSGLGDIINPGFLFIFQVFIMLVKILVHLSS
jgi:hypothetical protein